MLGLGWALCFLPRGAHCSVACVSTLLRVLPFILSPGGPRPLLLCVLHPAAKQWSSCLENSRQLQLHQQAFVRSRPRTACWVTIHPKWKTRLREACRARLPHPRQAHKQFCTAEEQA